MRDEWTFPNPATPLGSSTYYSLRFLPPELRQELALLHAWWAQVGEIPLRVREPSVALRKLGWWQEELERIEDRRPTHPLAQALQTVIRIRALPIVAFAEKVQSAERELSDPPRSSQALRQHCARDLGNLFMLCYRCQGLGENTGLRAAEALGTGCALIARIRDAGLLARRGISPVPLDWLREKGLHPAQLVSPEHRSALPDLLPRLGELAEDQWDAVPLRDQPLFARIQKRLCSALLEEITSLNFQVMEQRVSLTPLRKLWLAWREHRRT